MDLACRLGVPLHLDGHEKGRAFGDDENDKKVKELASREQASDKGSYKTQVVKFEETFKTYPFMTKKELRGIN